MPQGAVPQGAMPQGAVPLGGADSTTSPAPVAAPLGLGGAPFPGVRRIAVLRGGGLGDALFAEPAMAALAAAYPEARILLLCGPLAHALFTGRPGPVDEARVLPVRSGLHEPAGGVEDDVDTQRFLDAVREMRLDLAVQLHGGGRNSNPFLARLGARHTVGAATEDAPALERTLPYRYYQHEVLRALEIAGLAGAAPIRLNPRIQLRPGEHELTSDHWHGDGSPLVVLHPGATDERRRWPADRFGAIAARATRAGCRVLVVGTEEDRPAAERILAVAGAHRVASMAGKLAIPELVGLLAVADVVVANDSGPRHLAEALGTPTVGIYWVGNLINAGPLTRGRHRVLLGWTTHCPACGRDSTQVGWSAQRCEHDESFVADVPVEAVWQEVESLLTATTAPPGGR